MESPGPLTPVDPNTPSRHSQNKSQLSEKPLPPPPGALDRVRTENVQTGSPAPALDSPSHATRPSLTGMQSFVRPKKRVVWGGKSCIIALPLPNEHGKTTNRDSYMTPDDVAQRFKAWEDEGYDTRGFVLASPTTESSSSVTEGQSRAIQPDPTEEYRDRSRRSYRVSIPDRREWEAYVNHLKEEKLRALGVSSGDEEPPSRKSPAPSLMSRGASSQGSSMLLSPPLAPTSVGSMPYPPQYQGPASANALPAKQGVAHFPRYSVAAPFDGKPFQSPTQFPQARSPGSGAWSPQPFLSSQPNSRIGSPLASGPIQNLGQGFPQATPAIQSNMQTGSPQNPGDLLAQMRAQQSALQTQQMQQQQYQQQLIQNRLQPATTSPRPLEINIQPTQMDSRPEIVTPTPRGASHRQNPSESLQREVEEAEAALEASVNDALGVKEPLIESKLEDLKDKITKTVQAMPRDKSTPEKSIQASDKDAQIPNGHPVGQGSSEGQIDSEARERSKSSASKLNVNAPEFIFEPKQNPAPHVFSFLGNSEPGPVSTNTGHARKPSIGIASKFNVSAPVFTPQSAPKPTASAREFSFSSQGPSFNPDAPAFNPSAPAPKPENTANVTSSTTKAPENPVEAVQKIFGDINFADAIKLAKKSKALPILPPELKLNKDGAQDDIQEDESGRPVRADARQKRARRDQDDGDQVPMFASPSGTPWLDDGKEDRAAYFGNSESSSASERAEPDTLEAATDLLEEILDDMPVSEAESLLRATEPSENGEKGTASFAFRDVDQVASFSAALPPEFEPKKERHVVDPTPEDVAEATINFLSLSSQYKAEIDKTLQRRISDVSSISPPSSVSEGRQPRLLHNGDEVDRMDHADKSAPLRQDILDGVRYVEPTYDEIDTVMKHLNEDSDIGVVRRSSPPHQRSSTSSPLPPPTQSFQAPAAHQRLLPHNQLRSDAPSPSPNRLKGSFQYLPREPTDSESVDSAAQKAREMVARNARFSPSYRPSRNSPQINQLNSPSSSPPSEWNDAIPSADEEKFHSRTTFFDHRVNDVVGAIVQQRLDPLEKQLMAMNKHLQHFSGRSTSRRPRSSGAPVEIENSDADDEDDETQPLERSLSRLKSPVQDRKLDQLKSTINEMAAAQKGLAPTTQLLELMEAIKDVKASISQDPGSERQGPVGDVRGIVEEVVGKQLRGKSVPVTSSSQAVAAEKSQLQIAGLESMLKVAESRADDELKARRSIEDALADNQRLLRSALQEAAQQRESAEETERSLQQYHSEQHQLLKRMASLEGSQEQLEKMASDLTDKNVALEGTLSEYRLSSDKWRTDIDDARHENKDLRRHLNSLKGETEHLVLERQALRGKFDNLKDHMHVAVREAAAEQARSHGKDEEHRTRLDMLSARLEAEARTRERLEVEIERLEAQEKDSMKARFQVDQMQKANAHLDHLVGRLRSESHEQQTRAFRLERDLHIANETKITELHKTRSTMATDVEAAKSQVGVVRAEFQSMVSRLEKQLEDVAAEAENTKSRHELMLEEASDSRHAALREAAEAREAALQEHYRFHERTLNEVKVQHQRALDNTLEDKARSETHWGNRLSLADEKEKHLQGHVAHLEERLEIAKSAAHAAVQAAKSSKPASTMDAAVAAITESPSQGRRDLSSIPEKVSPQALRESILVLQEQLQAREGRIEDLEAQLSKVDNDAPNKLKEADIEITWLRELLGVRIDDLEDIIRTLSQPSYDREAVKDAAIRLKANLQMEQQEKERALAGGNTQTFPSLSSLAASPRAALPLAAAAAWGNWRKGRDSAFGSLSGMANGSASVQQTPSKSSTPQSLFAGLMTPPSTNIRSTPPFHQPGSRPTSSSSSSAGAIGNKPPRPLQRCGEAPSTPRQSFGGGETARPLMNKGGPMVTPPLNLMRKASYDLDAREAPVFDTEPRDTLAEVDGFNKGVYDELAAEEEPFGPRIGTFAS